MTDANTSSAAAVVVAKTLVKHYDDDRVVDDVSFTVQQGEFWGLLGPNGAGKTTLIRMLLGKTAPHEGHLTVLGHEIPAAAKSMRARVGIVPQFDLLDPNFTVHENLEIYGSYFGLSGDALAPRISQLLAFTALTAKAHAPVTTLSGGMRRRLSLSRSLINNPELLVLDEPTTGLDPQARQTIWRRLRELKQTGKTLILTTHYLEEAERLCDRVTIMDHGRFLDTDTPQALIEKHVPAQVVEVSGPELEAWHTRHGASLADESEAVGESRLYFVQDEGPLLSAVKREPNLTFLHRPANLEDVFMKLTGRELRDA